MRARYENIRVVLCVVVVVLLVSSVASAGWFGKKGVKGSGDMETRSFDVETFDSIDIGGAFDLDVRFGDEQSVEVTIDDNLWDILIAEVSHGTLEVSWDENCRPDGDCRIEVVVHSLEEIDIHGACDATVVGFDGERFEFGVSGAGDLEIDGTVEDLEIRISGAGDVDARDLKAKNVSVRISGAGNATVYAEDSIDARISGVGNLTYYGDPEERDTDVSGMGRIRRK